MDIINKVKWIAGILLVFVIIVTTNLIDRSNFNRLRYSVTTIYEDRIVANDLIFKMSRLIHEKEMAVATADSSFFYDENDEVNRDINDLIGQYEQTKLTNRERKIFNDLKEDLVKLSGLEKKLAGSDSEPDTELMSNLNDINNNLHDLSEVQLNEGKVQMSASNKTMESIDVFTQVEIVFLIIMGVLIQIIILYKPKD